VVHANDRPRAHNRTVCDHRRDLSNRKPRHRLGFVAVWRPDLLGAMRHIDLLRAISRSDDRLERQQMPYRPWPPPSLFLNLADRCRGAVFSLIDVPTRQFPDPTVDDEPMPPHQQDLLASLIQHHRHHASPHAHHVRTRRYLGLSLRDDANSTAHAENASSHPQWAAQYPRGGGAGPPLPSAHTLASRTKNLITGLIVHIDSRALRRLLGHPRLQTMIVETFQGLSLKSLHDHEIARHDLM